MLAGRVPGRIGTAVRDAASRRALDEVSPVIACAPALDLAHTFVYRVTGKSRLDERILKLLAQRFDRQVARRVGDIGTFIGQAGACQATLRALGPRGTRT